MSVMVKTTRSGIPTIILATIRKKIARRDDAADMLVRIFLSWFGLFRVLAPSSKTFESIVTPVKCTTSMLDGVA